MTAIRKLATALCLCALLTATACTSKPLLTPSFEVATQSQAKTHQVIKEALLNRKWFIVKDEPSAFEATYRRAGGATARIRVAHKGSTVTISHVESDGLKYGISEKTGEPTIHRTYNNWVTALERDIQLLSQR
jgi:hypothetical protein